MVQSDLLGPVSGDGSAARVARVAGAGPGVVLRVMVIGEDRAGGGVDLIVVLGVVRGVVELHLVHLAAVIPIQVAADKGNLAGGEPRVVQSDLLGPVGGDGSAAGAGIAGTAGIRAAGTGIAGAAGTASVRAAGAARIGVARVGVARIGVASAGVAGGGGAGGGAAGVLGGPDIVLHIKVIGENIAAKDVDLIVVLGVVGGVVELHIIDLAAVLIVQCAPQEGDLIGGEPRVVQGDLLGLLGGDGGAGAAAGAGGLGRAAEDVAGERVDAVRIALAVGGEINGIEVSAVLTVQAGGGEGGGGFRDARVLQGDGLGGIQTDVVGLGVLLAAAGNGQGKQGRPAQGGNRFQFLSHIHKGKISFLLVGPILPAQHEIKMKLKKEIKKFLLSFSHGESGLSMTGNIGPCEWGRRGWLSRTAAPNDQSGAVAARPASPPESGPPFSRL